MLLTSARRYVIEKSKHNSEVMKVELTKQMTELSGIDFMYYCTSEHPNKEFQDQCRMLRYAVMGDTKRFQECIDKTVSNPDKNFIPFYPAKADKKKVKGMEIVGTILDGRLYFG